MITGSAIALQGLALETLVRFFVNSNITHGATRILVETGNAQLRVQPTQASMQGMGGGCGAWSDGEGGTQNIALAAEFIEEATQVQAVDGT